MPLQFPLVAILVFAAGRANAEELPCRYAYREDFARTWSVSRDRWNENCDGTQAPSAEALLNAFKTEFIETCVKDSAPAIASGLVHKEFVELLCSEGRTGRELIPKPSGNDSAQGRVEASENRKRGQLRVAATIGGVADKLGAQDVPGVYSERAPTQEADGVYAGGGPNSAPAPVSAVPTSKAPARLSIAAIPAPRAADAGRQKYIDNILDRVAGNGASPEAVVNAKKALKAALDRIDPQVLKRLDDNEVTLEIIPKEGKLTDIPAFESLKGKKTFDGRAWDDTRGTSMNGHFAVPEENLLGGLGYQQYFQLYHEFGHTVLLQGLDDRGIIDKVRDLFGLGEIIGPKAEQVEAIYAASMKRKEKTALGDYADSNSEEMFAQATAAFFGRGFLYEDAEFLSKNNEQLYDLLESVYGRPRNPKS